MMRSQFWDARVRSRVARRGLAVGLAAVLAGVSLSSCASYQTEEEQAVVPLNREARDAGMPVQAEITEHGKGFQRLDVTSTERVTDPRLLHDAAIYAVDFGKRAEKATELDLDMIKLEAEIFDATVWFDTNLEDSAEELERLDVLLHAFGAIDWESEQTTGLLTTSVRSDRYYISFKDCDEDLDACEANNAGVARTILKELGPDYASDVQWGWDITRIVREADATKSSTPSSPPAKS